MNHHCRQRFSLFEGQQLRAERLQRSMLWLTNYGAFVLLIELFGHVQQRKISKSTACARSSLTQFNSKISARGGLSAILLITHYPYSTIIIFYPSCFTVVQYHTAPDTHQTVVDKTLNKYSNTTELVVKQ